MSSSAPKRRLEVSREAPNRATGKRVANRQRRNKRRLLPTPALAGALALIVAGVGSVAISSRTDSNALDSSYQTISVNYSGSSSGDGGDANVDISRDFDRDLLEKQANAQAQQREQALDQLAAKTQKRAQELKLNQWVLPVTGYHLTGRFGQSSSLWSSTHTGLDFAGPSGSTIVAVGGGTVKSAGSAGAYGNRTVITLPDGTDIWYCHQSRIGVQVGQKVDPGAVIGYTGSTGNVTGPHLHLEVHPNGGAAIDPGSALTAHGVTP
ncbi:MAG: M23 family metallopeptidase [Aeromicrobium sp.]